MKLERHVGGLSLGRKAHYLRTRGWREEQGRWASDRYGAYPLAKALHHQLTEDLSGALCALGWEISGYSERGYVQLRDGGGGRPCSLPKALRTLARRERRPVGELTYAFFLAALLDAEGAPPG